MGLSINQSHLTLVFSVLKEVVLMFMSIVIFTDEFLIIEISQSGIIIVAVIIIRTPFNLKHNSWVNHWRLSMGEEHFTYGI